VSAGTNARRLQLLVERLGERLGKSSRVFLIGLFIACGVEVAVDWNATLEEINVLRATMRQKAEDYVDILRRAAQPAVEAYDWDALDELSRGLLDDPDIVYVRFTDTLGNTLHDRVRDDYAATFVRANHITFRERYRHQMERDAAGMMTDPTQLRARIAQSRHRDFIQGFNDFEDLLLARFTSPPPAHEPPPQVLYQDRLYDDARQLDRALSYSLGVITTDRGDPTGVALIALRHDRINRAVARKLWKGLGITVFFVALILVQNVLGRRAKLRLLELEAALSAARAAVRAATPETPVYGPGQLGIAFAQADRLGGTVYDVRARADGSIDLLLAVPEGAGVDAAFASVVLRDVYRWQHTVSEPAERVARMMADYEASPLARDVELLCAHFDVNGYVRGVISGLRSPVCIDGHGAVRALTLDEPLTLRARRLPAPLTPFTASLAEGAFAIFDDGMPADAPRRLAPADVLAHMADRLRRKRQDAQSVAEEAVAEAVGAYRKRHTDDFFALVVTPSPRS
jgi:hypothetical protein